MDKEELSHYLAKLGAKGGKTAAQRLTKEQRIERACKAGKASQAKAKRGGKSFRKTNTDTTWVS
jgi:hypothetical protein